MARKETVLSDFHEPKIVGGLGEDGTVAPLERPIVPKRRKILAAIRTESFDVRIKGKRGPKKKGR